MKTLIRSLLATSALLVVAASAHAADYYSDYYGSDYAVVRAARPSQMVKYYKPTQTYYANGYVIRYGYTTTTPTASGYTATRESALRPTNLYLPVSNMESRRDTVPVRRAVHIASPQSAAAIQEKQAQGQPIREVQPVAASKDKPQDKVQDQAKPQDKAQPAQP